MTTSNLLYSIATRMKTQLQGINGTSPYNLTVLSTRVVLDFKAPEEVDGFPSIFIASIRSLGSRQFDQCNYDIPFEAEVFGYVQYQSDVLDYALKFASDIENAIYSDETLNSLVHGLSIDITAAALGDHGLVKALVRGTATHTIQ